MLSHLGIRASTGEVSAFGVGSHCKGQHCMIPTQEQADLLLYLRSSARLPQSRSSVISITDCPLLKVKQKWCLFTWEPRTLINWRTHISCTTTEGVPRCRLPQTSCTGEQVCSRAHAVPLPSPRGLRPQVQWSCCSLFPAALLSRQHPNF